MNKTTKAKRKVAVAKGKPEQKAVVIFKRSFLTILGFSLLGVLVGMVVIQAVESKWLRSEVEGSGTDDCFNLLDPKNESATRQSCMNCCGDDSQCRIFCIKQMTKLKSDDKEIQTQLAEAQSAQAASEESVLGKGSSLSASGDVDLKAAKAKAADCLQRAGGNVGDCQTCCADDIQCESYCESAPKSASGSSNNSGAFGGSAKTFATEAECKESGCNKCVKKSSGTSGSSNGASSSSGGSANDTGGTLTSSSVSSHENGYREAQNCMARANNDINDCKTCCESSGDAEVVSVCKDNCVAETASTQYDDDKSGSEAAQSCKGDTSNTEDCKTCCYNFGLNDNALSVCRDNCS